MTQYFGLDWLAMCLTFAEHETGPEIVALLICGEPRAAVGPMTIPVGRWR